jgi:DNA polymerase I
LQLRLKLNGDSAENETAREDVRARVKQASERKAAANETIEDAWQRILSMKNSDPDQAKLLEVKQAMASGKVGRNPADVSKRFSKAEALRLFKDLAESQREDKLAELVAKTPENYVLVSTRADIDALIADLQTADLIGLDCETFGEDNGALDPWRGNMAGFSVSTRQRHYYVPLNHEETPEGLIGVDIIGLLKPYLEQVKTVMHNAPFDCKWFYVKYGINLIDNLHADTRIMAMAFDENRSHRLKDLLTDWLRIPSDNFDQLFPNTQFNKIPLDVALPYAAGDTEKTLMLYDWISQFYSKSDDLKQIQRLVFEIEMPVCRQFIWSDIRGIRFDKDTASTIDEKLAKEEAELIAEITEMFGEEINLNSPVQLKRKLFVDLKLPDLEKGSTGVKALKKIKNAHPVVSKMLEYREVGKLRQAFTQKLPKEVKNDGRIHPWHNTLGAATGRFTCSNPNTQQIPAKRPEIRQLFLSTSEDRILVSIDYSQIELRVLAHLANEKELIKAFKEGLDIHSMTASMISAGKFTYEDIEKDKETQGSPQQKFRKQAKVVNFGIVYGMSAAGLSNTLEITKEEAQEIIDNYFKGYPGIKRYMDEQKRLARKQGYVTDLFGRKRRLNSDYRSKDRFQHFRADRMAGNFPVQASAGSILKKAIVDLQPVLKETDASILLQVHDELVIECPADITKEALYSIKETMEQAVTMVVPVRCDVEINPKRWFDKVEEDEWFANMRGEIA